MGQAGQLILRHVGKHAESDPLLYMLAPHITLHLLDFLYRTVGAANLQEVHRAGRGMAQFLPVLFQHSVVDIKFCHGHVSIHSSLVCRSFRRCPNNQAHLAAAGCRQGRKHSFEFDQVGRIKIAF